MRWENWESLRKEAVEFAAREIKRRKWRGSRRGVLPEALEAEDVVDEAIAGMLSGNCRLALGWVRERLMKELQRLISQKIRQLHARKETRATRSEWEMSVPDESGKVVSILELLPDEVAEENESRSATRELCQRLKKELEQFFCEEPELAAVLGCLWAGVTKPREIARRTGIEERLVAQARKKLNRRLREFVRQKNQTGRESFKIRRCGG